MRDRWLRANLIHDTDCGPRIWAVNVLIGALGRTGPAATGNDK